MSPRRRAHKAAAASKAKAGLASVATVVKKKVGGTFDNFNVRKRTVFDRFNTKA